MNIVLQLRMALLSPCSSGAAAPRQCADAGRRDVGARARGGRDGAAGIDAGWRGSRARARGGERRRADTSRHPIAHRLDPNIVYPADVLRVIDGDTFEARVRVWPDSTSIPKCGCAASMRRSFTPAAPASSSKRKPRASSWKRFGRRRRDDFPGRRRQIWRTGRCHDRDARHRRRVGGAAQWRLCARLRRREARELVLSRTTEDGRRRTDIRTPTLYLSSVVRRRRLSTALPPRACRS